VVIGSKRRTRPRATGVTASNRRDVPAATPWHWADAVKAAGLIAIGAILWFIGWYEVSDRAAMDDQIPPLNLAIVGVLIIGSGQASWFLAGRRAVGARRRVLLGAEAKPSPVRVMTDDRFAGGERFYHRIDCAMLTDRHWSPTSRAAHEADGREPCGVCKP
jgi:hypothetical protein